MFMIQTKKFSFAYVVLLNSKFTMLCVLVWIILVSISKFWSKKFMVEGQFYVEEL